MKPEVVQQIKTRPEIYRELSAHECACGKRKQGGKSFCWLCWSILPTAIKRRLYETVGYPNAVDEAKKILREIGRVS